MKARFIMSVIVTAWLCGGQTRLDLGRQSKSPDFSAMTHTRPVQMGADLPPACSVGELFFKSSSSTGGDSLHGCLSSGQWSKIGGVGECTVTAGALTCPGDLWAGTSGESAGEVQLFEKATSGVDFVSWLAPDSIALSYRLRLPDSPPSNQMLVFGASNGGIAQGFWAARPVKLMDSQYSPVAQRQGSAGWVLASGWSIPDDANGAAVGGGGTSPFQTGYLAFAPAMKRYTVFQTQLPNHWDGATVTVKLIWAANNGDASGTVKWQIASACVGNGAAMENPVFPVPQDVVTTVLYPGDTTSKRMTAAFDPLTLAGCSANSVLYLLVDRDGAADTNSTPVNLYGLQLDIGKELQ